MSKNGSYIKINVFLIRMTSLCRKAPEIANIAAPSRSNIVGICVCVNFADKLEVTLMNNKPLLDNIYVVTDTSDSATIACCSKFNVNVLQSNETYTEMAKFNKSGLIRYAQKHLHRLGGTWFLYFDADTLLPSNFYDILMSVKKWNHDTLYEMPRLIYESSNDADGIRGGPAGFFQLYCDKNKFYRPWSVSAEDCDMNFRSIFPHVEVLDGLCKHLGPTGVDWHGRISSPWTMRV